MGEIVVSDEFTTTDMNVAMRCLPKVNDGEIETVNGRAA